MPVVEITKENCDTELKNSTIPTVLDFWGPKCGPCLTLMPRYHELADSVEYQGKMKFCSVDTSKNKRVAVNLKVMSQPTFLFYKDGREVARISGGSTTIESIKSKIDELIISFGL